MGSKSMKHIGARRRADIPPDVLRAMNEGREETVSLVEWLALDLALLLEHVLPETSLAPAARRRVVAHARSLAEEGILTRLYGIGEALHREATPTLHDELAAHRSDVVRQFACAMLRADPTLAPEERLARTLRFADDAHMGVREIAWTSLRPSVIEDVGRWLRLLEPWARHASPNVRRCAVEGTRPRGVWCAHLRPLVEEPERGLPLLEPVRADPSRYVQTSVGNWLNDASKSRPEWVREVCSRWERESPTRETAWIVRHATRTLRRNAP